MKGYTPNKLFTKYLNHEFIIYKYKEKSAVSGFFCFLNMKYIYRVFYYINKLHFNLLNKRHLNIMRIIIHII